MSSEDSEHEALAKKRKLLRACDVCRKKKIKCDGPQMKEHKCTYCITNTLRCTYDEASQKRGPPKSYVSSLESRLEKMEGLLQKLCPDGDFSHELGGSVNKDAWNLLRGGAKPLSMVASSSSSKSPPPSMLSRESAAGTLDGGVESSDEEGSGAWLAGRLKWLQVNPAAPRFVGKASSIRLVKNALEIRKECMPTGDDDTSSTIRDAFGRRPEYWSVQPWEKSIVESYEVAARSVRFTFPPDDLLASLVDGFFENMNTFFPILHRPTFERGLADGLHRSDSGFATIVLLVCAIASRFIDDPRVLLPGASEQSAGWGYFNQVQAVRRSLLAPPCLYDIQWHCLTAWFIGGSSTPQGCWHVAGVGIRLAQDLGVHRRKVYGVMPSVQDELWKRAFWFLVHLDRMTSASLGRHCAIQDEDFDLDPPLECDDEYWETEDPAMAFKQPPGKPSKVAFFITLLKLNEILAFTLRTIYTIDKSKHLLGYTGEEWIHKIASQLDSALNKWVDSVPDHLRWDPQREPILFFSQSAVLYSHYYQLQILVHRPFIPVRGKTPNARLPSVAVCTNAARACAHLLQTQLSRNLVPHPIQMATAMTTGVMLLMSIWSGQRSGIAFDASRAMADVRTCMDVLKRVEPRWHMAGRLWDLLSELAAINGMPVSTPSPEASHKRPRGSGGISTLSDEPSPQDTGVGARPIVGSRRVYASAGGSASHAASSSAGMGASLGMGSVPRPPAFDPTLYAAAPSVGASSAGTADTPAGWSSLPPLPEGVSPPGVARFGASTAPSATPASSLQFGTESSSWWPGAEHAAPESLSGDMGFGVGYAPPSGFGQVYPPVGVGEIFAFPTDDASALWTRAPASFDTSQDWDQFFQGLAAMPPPDPAHTGAFGGGM